MTMDSLRNVSLLFTILLLLFARVAQTDEQSNGDRHQPVPVWCLDFSADGSMLAAAAGQRNGPGVVHVWNTHTWEPIFVVPEDRAATCVAFSPDGHSLAVGTQRGDIVIVIVDIPSQTTTRRWPSGKGAVFGVTWTPDSQRVVGACANGAIKVWDAKSGELQAALDIWKTDGIDDPGLRGHSDRNVWNLAVTSDGKTLLSGGWNDTTRVWSLETLELIHSFAGEDESTQGVELTPDERHFLTAGLGTGQVRIRETRSLRERVTLPVAGRDAAVHPDGGLIAASTLEDVRVYGVHLDAPAPAVALRAKTLIEQLNSDDVDLRTRAVLSLEKLGPTIEPILYEALQSAPEASVEPLRLLCEDFRKLVPVAVLDGLPGEVRQVAFSPTGKYLAASTTSGEVRIWNIPEFTTHRQFNVTIASE
jgi:WD40 repeat protein